MKIVCKIVGIMKSDNVTLPVTVYLKVTEGNIETGSFNVLVTREEFDAEQYKLEDELHFTAGTPPAPAAAPVIQMVPVAESHMRANGSDNPTEGATASVPAAAIPDPANGGEPAPATPDPIEVRANGDVTDPAPSAEPATAQVSA